MATRGGVSWLRVGDTIFTSRERGRGRIGGDVVSYVEYAIAALYEDAEKICRTCYRLLGVFHTGPSGGMKKCEGTSAFSEENPRHRRKSLLERRRRHVPNGTMEWNFVSTLLFCPGRHWRMMIVERLPYSRQEGKLLEARYSQLKLFQVHSRRHRPPDSRFT